MTTATQERTESSWVWLLALFTIAGLIETSFFGQMTTFTPLYLPQLGVPAAQVDDWTGWLPAISIALLVYASRQSTEIV